MLGLYIHIPFCSSICSYCNFNRGLLEPGLKIRYVAALEREIRTAALAFPGEAPVAADTIFFGGGTPSLLEPTEVRRLIQACRDRFELTADAEITLETNPETATPERLAAFRESGVNRISFGVQSFEDDELRRLDRVHSAARARAAVAEAREAGFDNLSFDLMLWLPGQSFSSWLRTVDEAVALAPEHLSMYLLELYPNAPLKETIARATAADGWQAPDDEAADMYLAGLERLDAAGLRQYEISNVARDGYECRHNVKYWRTGAWWGFGCGAHSTVGGWRWRNVSGTEDFIAKIADGRPVTEGLAQLSSDDRFAEAMFTGLRMSDGVDCGEIASRFGADPWEKHGQDLQPYVDAGLVWRRGSRLGLSRQGMLVANGILATFV